MNRFIRLLCLALALLLVQGLALAAPSRDIAFIDMDEEELEKLRESVGQKAIEAFRAANPAFPLDPDQDGMGLHIYALRDQDGLISLEGDLYLVAGMKVSPDDAPDDSLRWLCQFSAQLKRDAEAPGGFVLVGQQLSPVYAAQSFVLLEHPEETARFELMLPDFLQAPADLKAFPLVFSSPDGQAKLTLSLLPMEDRNEESERARLSEAHPSLHFAQAEEFGPSLEGAMPGYRVIQVHGEDLIYCLELQYPPQLEAEYSLYYQFIRNSFVVSEIAVG